MWSNYISAFLFLYYNRYEWVHFFCNLCTAHHLWCRARIRPYRHRSCVSSYSFSDHYKSKKQDLTHVFQALLFSPSIVLQPWRNATLSRYRCHFYNFLIFTIWSNCATRKYRFLEPPFSEAWVGIGIVVLLTILGLVEFNEAFAWIASALFLVAIFLIIYLAQRIILRLLQVRKKEEVMQDKNFTAQR